VPERSDGGGGSPDTHTPPIPTFFDYSDSEGFGHAVEQCNGAGVCRKRGGVMCPSYQGTLDERHSTRGRGNALRLAITGQFAGFNGAGKPNWEDPDTIETLSLCLSCKACKSECPSNVDIARLKAEYTAQRYRQTQNVPIAAMATGHVRVLNRLGAVMPGVANAAAASGPARAVINRVMGMHARRTLPRFSKSLYQLVSSPTVSEGSGQSANEQALPHGRAAYSVVLFTDCFTTYNESHIGVAAVKVLRALGYGVSLSGSHCCGRSMISVGMLPQAIETIDRAVESLRRAIEDDSVKAIVVCEPSCLSAIKDEWLGLKCATPIDLRRKLAAKAMLVEEFVERFWSTHPKPPTSDIPHPTSDILFHAHCHQKSLWGAESSAKLLRRLCGDRLKVLDTGCCGMAGSFGFDKNKYDLSMRIGELSLLPIVREAPADAIIVATGTSCRHQIHDGVHRQAIHPVELVAELLSQ
jgi:Fe-S oxidoreductase